MYIEDDKPKRREKLMIWLLLALILSKYASCSIKENWIPIIIHLENDIDSSDHVSSLFADNNLNGKSGLLAQVNASYGFHYFLIHTLDNIFFIHVINSSSKSW